MLKKELLAIWDKCLEKRTVAPKDQEIILDYLKQHDYYKNQASKKGAHLRVQLRTFGRFSAWVLILNNTLPVTKKRAFNHKGNAKTKINKALRNDVQHQILYFKGTINFPQTCYLSKDMLTSWSETDVDHVYPMSRLIEDWLKENGLEYSDIKLRGNVNNLTLKDEILKKSWQEYHYHHAELKCASKSANRSKGKKIINI